jgi:2-polyprenyl-6-methoxyphenol hydroxylase-like FAD-dependent oxidoreductase
MKSAPILIAGAGPTGLVLALWLTERGVPVRIIDKSSKPGQTSRALAVQARTLEFYRQLGIDQKIIAQGVRADSLKLWRSGKQVAEVPIGAIGRGITPHPYLLFLSQDVHEEILTEILKQKGVEVERETELLRLSQDAGGVNVRLKSARGEESARFEYLCGCDGAHSTVRHSLGLDFPGGTYSQVFFVTDVQASGAMAAGGVQISVSVKDFCIVMPIASQGSVRLTGIVPPSAEGKEKVEFADVKESVERNTALKIERVNWFSGYHVHHRVASRFRAGRVFLSGDSGHIHSPAGGQGMNTGIGDAVNLAWKLAEALKGRSKILESYEPERMAFARVLVRTTDTAFRFIANRSILGSVFRAFILPNLFATLARLGPALKLMFLTISQTRIHYRASSLSRGQAGGVEGGDRLPYIETLQNFDPLRSLDWQVHVYGEVRSRLRDFCSAKNIELHEFRHLPECDRKGLQEDAIYFIRPDGHVAFADVTQDTGLLEKYIDGLT